MTGLGQLLKVYRRTRSLSPLALAKRVGITVRELQAIEANRVTRFPDDVLMRLAAALDMKATDLENAAWLTRDMHGRQVRFDDPPIAAMRELQRPDSELGDVEWRWQTMPLLARMDLVERVELDLYAQRVYKQADEFLAQAEAARQRDRKPPAEPPAPEPE